MRLFKSVEALRSSYWFVPSLMAVAGIALGILVVWFDTGPGADLLSGLSWYQSAKPDGAQEVLSTIAGSMITVAGVVFSITIVAIAYASSQYGPRVLTNFMSDRGHQVTLGTFIATFLYCIIVLRTIRGGESEFVPQVGVALGLVLAVCSIGVLIYFIHHVTHSIHINTVVANIGRQLIDAVSDRYPTNLGDPADDVEPADKSAASQRRVVAATLTIDSRASGYIQAVDEDKLLETAVQFGLVLRLLHRPGDYVHAGRALLDALSPRPLSDEAVASLRSCYSLGTRRTPRHDLDFLVDELVEIAARALSTGVNDPTTAATCLDWLGAGSSEMATRRLPSPQRVDDEGALRVLAQPESFDSFVDRGFGAVRQYAARDRNAAIHMLRTLDGVSRDCSRDDRVEVLLREADRLVDQARAALDAIAFDEVNRCRAALPSLAATGTVRRRRKVG